MNLLRVAAHCLPCLLALVLAACAGSSSSPPSARSSMANAEFAAAPQDRPGLGTRWGETRESRVAGARFERANAARPSAVAAIYYNDAAGIHAMAGATKLRRDWPMLPTATAQLASVALRDESGRFLPGLVVGDRWFVVGEEGRRYTIVVRNRSEQRLEVVLSVDGLDVLDGRRASFAKRGYVIKPHGEVTVAGFRRSADAVAAFRFSQCENHTRMRNMATRTTLA